MVYHPSLLPSIGNLVTALNSFADSHNRFNSRPQASVLARNDILTILAVLSKFPGFQDRSIRQFKQGCQYYHYLGVIEITMFLALYYHFIILYTIK